MKHASYAGRRASHLVDCVRVSARDQNLDTQLAVVLPDPTKGSVTIA